VLPESRKQRRHTSEDDDWDVEHQSDHDEGDPQDAEDGSSDLVHTLKLAWCAPVFVTSTTLSEDCDAERAREDCRGDSCELACGHVGDIGERDIGARGSAA
jgi:hypothetical protein